MARLFISHSSADNAAARALAHWLEEHGWDDVFLDIHAERGLVAGEKWNDALKAAADRCEAVLCLVSPAWLDSKYCQAEFQLAKWLGKRIFGLIVDPVPRERIPVEMTAEWQMCELAGEDQLREFEVEVLGRQAQVAFREAGLDLLRRGLERAGLDARSFPWPPRDEPNRAPYRGLKALEPQDAAIFFGRDAWIVRGLDRIRGLAERGVEHMLVILGASGSGKSSFMRAGLWPRLLRDDLNFLPLPIVRPQTAVMSGSSGLAASLSSAFARVGETRPPGRVREALAEGTAGLARLLNEVSVLAKRRHVARAEPPGDPAIVLPLDQAEELFNPEGAAEAAVFIDLLAGMLTRNDARPRLIVVATMRSDRLELLQNEPYLDGVNRELFDLPPIPPAEFKSAIEGPARRVAESGGSLTIDPTLTERLIADAQGADALPLLGFTLERLYADYGAEGRLGLAEYERMGGVQGSIEAAVAAALAEPGRAPTIPAEREAQFAALRSAFIPWLARIEPENGAPMRRVARRKEIPEGSRAIVERLVGARLLVADRRDRADVIEIAHEALLRQWPALAAWLDADTADLALVEGVERAAAEWQRNGRLDSWLDHRGERLAEAERLLVREDFRRRLEPDGAAYLAACRTRQKAERHQRERLQRRILFGTVAALLAVTILGVFASFQWLQTERHRAAAERSKAEAELQRSVAQDRANEAHEQRDRALLNASRRLEDIAGQALARNDPASAVLLALEGLPGPEADEARPYDAVLDAILYEAGTALRELPALGVSQISHDKKRIAAGDDNGTIVIYDLETGKPLVTAEGHAGPVSVIKFTEHDEMMASGSADSTARLFDPRTGRTLRVLRGEEGPIDFIAFSEHDQLLASGSETGTVRLWNTADGELKAVLRGHQGKINTVYVNNERHRAVSTAEDGTARLWDTVTGREIAYAEIRDRPAGANAQSWLFAHFSSDGRFVLVQIPAGEKTTFLVWDSATGHEIAGFDDATNAFFATKAGLLVVRNYHNGHTTLFDPASNNVLLRGTTEFALSYNAERGVEWSKQSSTARLWDLAAGRPLADLALGTAPLVAVEAMDSKRVFTADSDGNVGFWDADTGSLLRSHEMSSTLGSDGIISKEKIKHALNYFKGNRLVTIGETGLMQIWDPARGEEVSRARIDKGQLPEFGRNYARMAALTESGIRVWDLEKGSMFPAPEGAFDPNVTRSIAIDSETGSRIAASTGPQSITIWDVQTGKKRSEIKAPSSSYWRFSSDAGTLRTEAKGLFQLWDTDSGRLLGAMRNDAKNYVSFTPAGHMLIETEQPRTFGPVARTRWWRTARSPMTSVTLEGGALEQFAFWGDGKRDGMLGVQIEAEKPIYAAKIYDARSGQFIRDLTGNNDKFLDTRLLNDRRLVTYSGDGKARIWDVQDGQTLAVVDAKFGSHIGHRLLQVKTSEQRMQLWDIAKAELRFELTGVTENIQRYALGTQERFLATWSLNGGGRLWDLASGSQIRFFPGATNFLLGEDEQRAVVEFEKGPALLVETKTGQTITELPDWQAGKFSEDGSCLLEVAKDSSRLVNAETGAFRAALPRDVRPVGAIIGTGCSIMATKAKDGKIGLWDARTGTELNSPAVAAMSHFRAIADGHQLLFWDDKNASLVDGSTASEKLLEGQSEPITSFQYSNSTAGLLIVSRHEARIWDTERAVQVAVLPSPDAAILQAGFSADGSRIVMVTEDRAVHLYDAHTGAATATLQFADYESPKPVLSETGAHLLVTTSHAFAPGANFISRFNDKGEIDGSFKHRDAVSAVAVSGDATRLLVASKDRKVTLWDFLSQRRIAEFDDVPALVQSDPDAAMNGVLGNPSLAISSDRSRVAATFNNYRNLRIRLWDASVPRLITAYDAEIEQGIGDVRARFTSDGRYLLVIAEHYQSVPRLFLFDGETGKLVSERNDFGSGAGDKVLIGNTARYVLLPNNGSLWDVIENRPITTIKGSATFSPNDRWISIVHEKEIEIWDTATGELHKTLVGHTGSVESVEFSADSTELVSGSYDGTARIWRVETGEQVRTFAPDENPFAPKSDDREIVHRVRISADGTRVATQTTKQIALWSVATGEETVAFPVPEGRSLSGFSPGGEILRLEGQKYLRVEGRDVRDDLLFRIFPTTQEAVLAGREAVPRCLSLAERVANFLDSEPPAWCIEMKKQPYNSSDWLDWLRFKRAKLNPPFPESPEWKSWRATRVSGSAR